MKSAEPLSPPEFTPPTEARFIPAAMFEKVEVEKTWDLNAIRGGKFGIGWTMNMKLWPDADKVDYPLGTPRKIVFKNSSSRLHPMHIHSVFFRVLERNSKCQNNIREKNADHNLPAFFIFYKKVIFS